jgi:hypothetical protein
MRGDRRGQVVDGLAVGETREVRIATVILK